ncbi:hypothetical protein SAMN04488563_0419 [Jiangella alkaliphila]|uniref:Uncharacterized protein n=1 Tax=Jiangella alkaliphila TaxID=419479 RepID=A0A1H2GC58_9ACTN|nr:hypothetical protein [Jiangella alkaliphila]SDU17243.1 hypothetical protein SAMN04488563_0419 [Jiangella alkaliphila]
MATYGIEQAMLSADHPDRDHPQGRTFEVRPPWAAENSELLGRIAYNLRCRAARLEFPGRRHPVTVRVHGFASDLERVDILYTSLLVQMHGALLTETVPPGVNARAWRRSWLLGFTAEVTERIMYAEAAARQDASATTGSGKGTDLVLADREARVLQMQAQEFPNLLKERPVTYTGSGFTDGRLAGARADIGRSRITDEGRDGIEH